MAKMEQKREDKLVKDYEKKAGQGKGRGVAPTGLEFSSHQAHMASFPSSRVFPSTSSSSEAESEERQRCLLSPASSPGDAGEEGRQLLSSPCRVYAECKPVPGEEPAAAYRPVRQTRTALLSCVVPGSRSLSCSSFHDPCSAEVLRAVESGRNVPDVSAGFRSRGCSGTVSIGPEVRQDDTAGSSSVGLGASCDAVAKEDQSDGDARIPDAVAAGTRSEEGRKCPLSFRGFSSGRPACVPTRRTLLRRLSDRLREAIEESETLLARQVVAAPRSRATTGACRGVRPDVSAEKRTGFAQSDPAGLPGSFHQGDYNGAFVSEGTVTSQSTGERSLFRRRSECNAEVFQITELSSHSSCSGARLRFRQECRDDGIASCVLWRASLPYLSSGDLSLSMYPQTRVRTLPRAGTERHRIGARRHSPRSSSALPSTLKLWSCKCSSS